MTETIVAVFVFLIISIFLGHAFGAFRMR